ncbi:MAG TPA: winged helix-turn-helix domain-containing protein [Candidatus Acidoferrales bacterium]
MQVPGHNVKGYRFGAFDVDLVTGEIRKNGRKIRLQDQPFRVLALLLQRYPELVSREEMRNQLWGEDTFVEFDHGLSNAISRIRDALGDSAEKANFIETLPKRGYRFLVPVEPIEKNGASSRAKADETSAEKGGTVLSSAVANNRLSEKPVAPGIPQAEAKSNSKIWPKLAVGIAVVVALGLMLAARALFEPPPSAPQYKQLTSFEDEAFSPALSPDGRMIAFIRGSDLAFPNFGEVYAKILPDGDPVQLTNDTLSKYGVAFSPDGTQITYTALEPGRGWTTRAVSPLGGTPSLFLPNAAGLTWIDAHHVLFGETKSGIHLGLVTSTDARAELRDIYLPAHERGMAHVGRISPNHKWVLIVEMGPTGQWLPCRLVPFDGSSAGEEVGPAERCTAADWSPDGNWMYFSAGAVGSSHIWREAFPKGPVQQITSGPTDESGVVVRPDGRSLITAIGVRDSGIWMTDSHGDRLLFSHGYESQPSFSRDGRSLYFLARRDSPDSNNELWTLDIASGKSEPIVQGFPIGTYSVSPDGKQILFSSVPHGAPSQIWIVSRDRSSEPRMLTSSGEDRPNFAADGYIVFRASENGSNYVFRMKQDGTDRAKVFPGAIIDFSAVSPDGRWVLAFVLVSNEPDPTANDALPLESGPAKRICPGSCAAGWSPEGTRFYVEPSFDGPIKAVVMPVPKGDSFPKLLPATGVRSVDDFRSVSGASVIDLSQIDPNRCGCNLAPGLENGTFAYVKTVVHRNLFEVPLP